MNREPAATPRMVWRLPPTALSLGLALLLAGCATSNPPRQEPVTTNDVTVRNNTYSLLYDLLQDERHLSKILIIKRESRALNQLVKQISDVAAVGAERLKEFAKQDRSLQLLAIALPSGEVATRKAIADTKKNQLLGKSGLEFERTLLMTQLEALNYGSHLAEVAAKNDTEPNRVQYLLGWSKSAQELRQQAIHLLFNQTTASR